MNKEKEDTSGDVKEKGGGTVWCVHFRHRESGELWFVQQTVFGELLDLSSQVTDPGDIGSSLD